MMKNAFMRVRPLICSLTASFSLLFLLLSVTAHSRTTAAFPQSVPIVVAKQPVIVDHSPSPFNQSDQRYIIEFAPPPSLADLPIGNTLQRRTALVTAYRQDAERSQADTLARLQSLAQGGDVQSYRSLWIINAIAVTGNPTAIYDLAVDPAVRNIRPDQLVHRFIPPDNEEFMAQIMATTAFTGPISNWGLERIRARHVWHGLGIDGGGVTVAIMDSGVDWLHPDLLPNYRGNLGGGAAVHEGNWFHAAMPEIETPVDMLGHGTHVAGTAVGQNGIGIAPGANWIAVSIASADGGIYESDAHAGFQWLLAPNGDPALAPDLINASWGSYPANTLFAADVAALQQAGITPIFSAGNSGPEAGSIHSPAALDQVPAIGASDESDKVAWFSSRGPSPLSAEQKPLIVAPGTRILSALPGDEYGFNNGTSMAAPHAVGTPALLLPAAPGRDPAELTQMMADAATPIAPFHPNHDSGYGRLDAYDAVNGLAAGGLISAGTLQGQLTSNGQPLPEAKVIISTTDGVSLPFVTDEDGWFSAVLQPGSYDLLVDLFGYLPATEADLVVQAGVTTTDHIDITPLPVGSLTGTVLNALDNQPLAGAEIRIGGTPITLLSNVHGEFETDLPEGNYLLTAGKTGYRLVSQTVSIQTDQQTTTDFSLPPGPSLLIVDSGAWYYDSHVDYYTNSLDSLGYAYDIWSVNSPTAHTPALADLTPYDTLIWSAPDDSPGLIQANDVLTDYLATGGNLLISGQNIGNFDGNFLTVQPWWVRDLDAIYVGDTYQPPPISGAADTLFSGIDLTLNGGDSADNQREPDISAPRADSNTVAALYYADGDIAALHAGRCRPFEIVYLGFGLEGIREAADREAIIDRSLAAFDQPDTLFGAQFSPQESYNLALPGDEVEISLTLQNLSESLTDTFTLSLNTAGWSGNLVTSTLELAPCERGNSIVRLQVPDTVPPDSLQQTWVTAVSQNNPAVNTELPIDIKTAGHILLVDDHRFYDRTGDYTGALHDLGLEYDLYHTSHSMPAGQLHRGEFLAAYDLIIWYTGYDWFAPLTAAEEAALTAYLAGGGRLFLSSQDYLFWHHDSEFSRSYLGVDDHYENFAITTLYNFDSPRLGGGAPQSMPLEFAPYQNHADGLIPAEHAIPFYWGNEGLPASLAHAGTHWRAIFWGVPWETLEPEVRTPVLADILGWLTDFGDSTFTVDRRTGAKSEARLYTLRLVNSNTTDAKTVTISNTLSPYLSILPETVRGGATYDAGTRNLRWSGEVSAGGVHTITYQAMPQPLLPPDIPIVNEVLIESGMRGITFTRSNTVWVEGPDYSTSSLTAVTDTPIAPGKITYTLTIINSSLTSGNPLSVNVRLPDTLFFISDTLQASQGAAELAPRRVLWSGEIQPQETVSISLVTTRPLSLQDQLLPAAAILDDGLTAPILITNWLEAPVYHNFFPIFPITGSENLMTTITVQNPQSPVISQRLQRP